MGADGCIFCKIVAGDIPVTKVYEDEDILSFLDIGPLSDGHTLIIPKEHYERLHDCPPEILGKIGSRLGRLAGAIAEAMGADGYNLLCNNGRAAGQLVNHLHFHIVPRSTGDGVFDRWPTRKYKEGKIEQIADKIRKNL